MSRFGRSWVIRVTGGAALSAPAATAGAQVGGLESAPAMPFWAMLLLVGLIGTVGYLMTRKR